MFLLSLLFRITVMGVLMGNVWWVSQGFVNRKTGEAQLHFDAEFVLTAGPLYTVRALSCALLHINPRCRHVHQAASLKWIMASKPYGSSFGY